MGAALVETALGPEAPPKCTRCPRLVAYRAENERQEPDWFNGAVGSFGTPNCSLLIVGLAPGRNGANRTGRPFTGDYAGDLLYGTLIRYGFATGEYHARVDDSLRLRNCMITNAVRCVPPRTSLSRQKLQTAVPTLQRGLKVCQN